MQEDRPNIEDDLDLEETDGDEAGVVVDHDDTSPTEPPPSLEDDEVESFRDRDGCQEATHETTASPEGSVGCVETCLHPERLSATASEPEPARRFDLNRVHGGFQQWVHRQGARVSGIVPHPLVAVGVVMLVGGGIYEISGGGKKEEAAKRPPPARAVSGGFAAPDFRMADKGSITERQAAAALARHRIENGGGERTGRQCAARGALDAGAASEPGGTTTLPMDGLFTAEQMEDAVARAREDALAQVADKATQRSRRGRGRGRRVTTRVSRSVPIPPAVAKTESAEAEERRSLPAYLVGFSDDESKEAPEVPKMDLPVGTRIPAVLDLGISSARHGTAVARTTAPIVDASGRKIPAGSVLTGRSSSSQERVYVDFTAIRVGAETFQLRAVGTENEDLGLLAERVEAPLNERTASRLADGALGAVRGLAAAGGGMVGRALSQATGGVINEAQREQRVDRSVTLRVAAGTAFVVVVTG